MTTNSAGADWYPDPLGRHEHRYYDGTSWTGHVADAGVSAFDPLEAQASPQAATAQASWQGGEPGAGQFSDSLSTPPIDHDAWSAPTATGAELSRPRRQPALYRRPTFLVVAALVVLSAAGGVAYGLTGSSSPTTSSTTTTTTLAPSTSPAQATAAATIAAAINLRKGDLPSTWSPESNTSTSTPHPTPAQVTNLERHLSGCLGISSAQAADVLDGFLDVTRPEVILARASPTFAAPYNGKDLWTARSVVNVLMTHADLTSEYATVAKPQYGACLQAVYVVVLAQEATTGSPPVSNVHVQSAPLPGLPAGESGVEVTLTASTSSAGHTILIRNIAYLIAGGRAAVTVALTSFGGAFPPALQSHLLKLVAGRVAGQLSS